MKKLLVVITFLVVIAGLCFVDYYIWRKGHPNAPTWVYFVSE